MSGVAPKKNLCTFSTFYLQNIYNTLSKVNNGRVVHKRDNCRQSIYFYIKLMEKGYVLSERDTYNLERTLADAKEVIDSTWGKNVSRNSWWADPSDGG